MTITDDALSMKFIEPTVARSIRERSGLTQVRVASEIDVTPYTVQRWESGKSRPRGGMRLRYARLLAQLEEGSKNGATFPNPRSLDAMGRMVTVQAAADRVGCSDRAVREAIEAGTLPGEKVGHVWLISERDLDRFNTIERNSE